jgi:pimeloyl-ACP methyl ester carboxylesterase
MTTEPVPVWPGEFVGLPDVGNVFVRSAPALSGSAQPAVFVHGLGGASTNWTDLMDVLRRPAAGGSKPDLPALHGEALDLPGFGYSPVPADGDYSVTGRAKAVIGLIEQRRNGPVHLIGNSLGGAVCTRVAALRPDLIRTLTLISPALPDLWPRPLPLRVSVLCAPGLGAWALRRVGLIPAEVRTATVVKDVYADPALMHPVRYAEATAEVLRRDELDYHNEVMIASARALIAEYTRPGPLSLWRDAARVSAPTLVLYGSHDRLVRSALAGRAARVFQRARVVVLPQTGHVAMMERPTWVAREIRALLSSVARAQRTAARRSVPGLAGAGGAG